MPRVLLPTIEAPGFRGGVARYIEAITQTFGDQVEVAAFAVWPGYRKAVGLFLRRRRDYAALWIHHVLPFGTAAFISRMLRGRPYVIFLHGMDFDLARQTAIRRKLLWCILRVAKGVVTNSSALAHEVAAYAHIPLPRVVYPCVSDSLVLAAETREPREPSEHTRLLTVARLVERKGHLKVLEAMTSNPNLVYDIVGDGPMRETIARRVEELGLGDRVTMHVDVADAALPEFYKNADIFVMPTTKTATDREGFGIVYITAGLFGLPAIAVRQPGVDEAVIDGVTGLLIEDNIASLEQAIARLRDDKKLCRDLGEQGRERVLRQFTRERQFATLKDLL